MDSDMDYDSEVSDESHDESYMDADSTHSDYEDNYFCDEEEVDGWQNEEIEPTTNTDTDTNTDSESEDDDIHTGVYKHHQTTERFGPQSDVRGMQQRIRIQRQALDQNEKDVVNTSRFRFMELYLRSFRR